MYSPLSKSKSFGRISTVSSLIYSSKQMNQALCCLQFRPAFISSKLIQINLILKKPMCRGPAICSQHEEKVFNYNNRSGCNQLPYYSAPSNPSNKMYLAIKYINIQYKRFFLIYSSVALFPIFSISLSISKYTTMHNLLIQI